MTVYNEIDAVNFSTLKYMAQGPLHYKAALERAWKQTPAMLIGSMVHCLVLEPDQFNGRYCIDDSGRNSKAYRELAKLELDVGREVVKSSQFLEAQRIAEGVRHNPEAMELLNGCKFEQVLQWEINGTKCKGRADAINPERNILIDLKTTRDPQPWAFARQVLKMNYHAQLAFYGEGVATQYEMNGIPESYLIAVGNQAPYECIVYHVPVEALSAGEDLYMKWLDELKTCREQGLFESRYAGVQELELPAWAVSEADEETSLIIGGEEVAI